MTQIMRYRDMFVQLLPQGAVWNPNDHYIQSFALALGDELDTLYRKFQEFKINLNPQSACALLSEWEADTGLPDHCLQISNNDALRRRNILMRTF